MPSSEHDSGPDPVGALKRWRRGRVLVVAATALLAGGVGFAVAMALSGSTSCAAGRSPFTFALLIGFTAAFAAASAWQERR